MRWILLVGTFIAVSPGPLAAESLSCGTPHPITELAKETDTQLDSLSR